MTRKIEKGYCAHNRNITEVWCEGCSYVNYGKDCHNNQLPLLKLANFTLHKQDEYVEKWRELGFEIDPAPRSPLVEYEKEEWTEAKIFKTVQKEIEKIYEEGYKYILIGGLANVMIYAYHIAEDLGINTIMAKTLRIRTEDGKFVFVPQGYATLLNTINMFDLGGDSI